MCQYSKTIITFIKDSMIDIVSEHTLHIYRTIFSQIVNTRSKNTCN